MQLPASEHAAEAAERLFEPFAGALAVALIAPAAVYGVRGNVTLLWHWWQTVTTTTAPNLLLQDNVSFASAWAKWLGPGKVASAVAIESQKRLIRTSVRQTFFCSVSVLTKVGITLPRLAACSRP